MKTRFRIVGAAAGCIPTGGYIAFFIWVGETRFTISGFVYFAIACLIFVYFGRQIIWYYEPTGRDRRQPCSSDDGLSQARHADDTTDRGVKQPQLDAQQTSGSSYGEYHRRKRPMKAKHLLTATCLSIGIAATSHAQPTGTQQSLAPSAALHAIDTNKDATISLDEAKKAAVKEFAALDTSHEGTLDVTELMGTLIPEQLKQANPDKDGTLD